MKKRYVLRRISHSTVRTYSGQREAERFRALRRERAESEFVPEEESDTDEEDDQGYRGRDEQMADDDAKASFERLIRERFIYGLLEARR